MKHMKLIFIFIVLLLVLGAFLFATYAYPVLLLHDADYISVDGDGGDTRTYDLEDWELKRVTDANLKPFWEHGRVHFEDGRALDICFDVISNQFVFETGNKYTYALVEREG